jgi:hypothetical protein
LGFLPDNEPDIYTLTLPLAAFNLCLISGNPVPLLAQSIKIEANLGNRSYNANGLLHEFKVITSDGVQYHFGSPVGTSNFKESVSVKTRILEIPEQAVRMILRVLILISGI